MQHNTIDFHGFENLPVITNSGPCNSNRWFQDRNIDNTLKLNNITSENTALLVIQSHGTVTYSLDNNYFIVPENVNLITLVPHGFLQNSDNVGGLLATYGYTNYNTMQSMKSLIFEYLNFFDKPYNNLYEVSPGSIRYKAQIIFNARLIKIFKIFFNYMIYEIINYLGGNLQYNHVLSPHGLMVFNSLSNLENSLNFNKIINYTCSKCTPAHIREQKKQNYINILHAELVNANQQVPIDINGNIINFETLIADKALKKRIREQIQYIPYTDRVNFYPDISSNCICDVFPVNQYLTMNIMSNNIKFIQQYFIRNNFDNIKTNFNIKSILENLIRDFPDLFNNDPINMTFGPPVELRKLIKIMLQRQTDDPNDTPIKTYSKYYYLHTMIYFYEVSIENMILNHGFNISPIFQRNISLYAIYLQHLCNETTYLHQATNDQYASTLNMRMRLAVSGFSVGNLNNLIDFENLIFKTLYLDVFKSGSACPQMYLAFTPSSENCYIKSGLFKHNLNLPNNITNRKKYYFPHYGTTEANFVTVTTALGNQMGYVTTDAAGNIHENGLVSFGCVSDTTTRLKNYGYQYFYYTQPPPDINKLILMSRYSRASFYAGSYSFNVRTRNLLVSSNFFELCLNNIVQSHVRYANATIGLNNNNILTQDPNIPVLSCYMHVPLITLENIVKNINNNDFLDLYNNTQITKYIIVDACKRPSNGNDLLNVYHVDFINAELNKIIVKANNHLNIQRETIYTGEQHPRYPVANLVQPMPYYNQIMNSRHISHNLTNQQQSQLIIHQKQPQLIIHQKQPQLYKPPYPVASLAKYRCIARKNNIFLVYVINDRDDISKNEYYFITKKQEGIYERVWPSIDNVYVAIEPNININVSEIDLLDCSSEFDIGSGVSNSINIIDANNTRQTVNQRLEQGLDTRQPLYLQRRLNQDLQQQQQNYEILPYRCVQKQGNFLTLKYLNELFYVLDNEINFLPIVRFNNGTSYAVLNYPPIEKNLVNMMSCNQTGGGDFCENLFSITDLKEWCDFLKLLDDKIKLRTFQIGKEKFELYSSDVFDKISTMDIYKLNDHVINDKNSLYISIDKDKISGIKNGKFKELDIDECEIFTDVHNKKANIKDIKINETNKKENEEEFDKIILNQKQIIKLKLKESKKINKSIHELLLSETFIQNLNNNPNPQEKIKLISYKTLSKKRSNFLNGDTVDNIINKTMLAIEETNKNKLKEVNYESDEIKKLYDVIAFNDNVLFPNAISIKNKITNKNKKTLNHDKLSKILDNKIALISELNEIYVKNHKINMTYLLNFDVGNKKIIKDKSLEVSDKKQHGSGNLLSSKLPQNNNDNFNKYIKYKLKYLKLRADKNKPVKYKILVNEK